MFSYILEQTIYIITLFIINQIIASKRSFQINMRGYQKTNKFINGSEQSFTINGILKGGVIALKLANNSNQKQNDRNTLVGKLVPLELLKKYFGSNIQQMNQFLEESISVGNSYQNQQWAVKAAQIQNMLRKSQQLIRVERKKTSQLQPKQNQLKFQKNIQKDNKYQHFSNVTDIIIKSLLQISNKIGSLETINKLYQTQQKNISFQDEKIMARTYQSINRLEIQFQKKVKEHQNKIEEINKFIQQRKTTIIELETKMEEKQEQLNRIIEKLTSLAQYNEETFDKLHDRLKKVEYNQKFLTIGKSLQLDSVNEQPIQRLIEKLISKPTQIKSKDWVDEFATHYNRLSLNGNTIALKANEGATIFGKNALGDKQTFKIKFQKISGVAILGIVDAKLRLKSIDPLRPDPNYNVLMYTNNGLSYDGKRYNQTCSQGFKTGGAVTVKIDFKKNIVDWKIEMNNKIFSSSERIRDATIKWVPFVYLSNKDDLISIWNQ